MQRCVATSIQVLANSAHVLLCTYQSTSPSAMSFTRKAKKKSPSAISTTGHLTIQRLKMVDNTVYFVLNLYNANRKHVRSNIFVKASKVKGVKLHDDWLTGTHEAALEYRNSLCYRDVVRHDEETALGERFRFALQNR